MKRNNKSFIIILLLALSSTVAFAQEKYEDINHDEGLNVYASFSYGFPINTKNEMMHYDYSLGANSHFDFNFNKTFAARFDVGWHEFNGPEREYLDTDGNIHKEEVNLSVWEFTAGLRAKKSIFYLEGRGGYFTGIHRWGVIPAVGIKYRMFDIQSSITFAKDMQWGGIRVAYFF